MLVTTELPFVFVPKKKGQMHHFTWPPLLGVNNRRFKLLTNLVEVKSFLLQVLVRVKVVVLIVLCAKKKQSITRERSTLSFHMK